MFKYIKQFWKDNLMVCLILFGAALSQTVAGMLNASVLNALIAFDLQSFLTGILQILAAYVVFLVFTYLQILKISQTKQKMATAIRIDITKRLEQTSYAEFHERQVGTYASWLSNDLATIEAQGYDNFYTVLAGIIAAVTSITALLFYHWSLFMWVLIMGGTTLMLPKLVEKNMSEASLAATQENERFLSKVTDVLKGFDTLFSFNLISKLTKDTKKASTKLGTIKNRQASVVGKVGILGATGNVLGQLSIFGLTGFLAFRSILSIGSISATGNLASTIFNAIGNLSQQIAGARATKPIFEKFETIERLKEESKNGVSSVKEGFVLDQLSYSYGEKRVLTKLSQKFSPGGKYAIVGTSGSGKSTLLNLLNGKLTDYQGSITFSGIELSQLTGSELRNHILYIDQIPYLFDTTIRENITLDEPFSDDEIEKALEDSSLKEVIEELPGGIDTPVGDAGRLFSGGQRQRIALARGLIRGKKWILLDEGTSSLDEASALKIEEKLINNPELTVIMITHQLRESIKEKLVDIVALV